MSLSSPTTAADAGEANSSGYVGGMWSEAEHRGFLAGLKKFGKVLLPVSSTFFLKHTGLWLDA